MTQNYKCIKEILKSASEIYIPNTTVFGKFCKSIPNFTKEEIYTNIMILENRNYLDLHTIKVLGITAPQIRYVQPLTEKGIELLKLAEKDDWESIARTIDF